MIIRITLILKMNDIVYKLSMQKTWHDLLLDWRLRFVKILTIFAYEPRVHHDLQSIVFGQSESCTDRVTQPRPVHGLWAGLFVNSFMKQKPVDLSPAQSVVSWARLGLLPFFYVRNGLGWVVLTTGQAGFGFTVFCVTNGLSKNPAHDPRTEQGWVHSIRAELCERLFFHTIQFSEKYG